jgi:hypothetical protein
MKASAKDGSEGQKIRAMTTDADAEIEELKASIRRAENKIANLIARHPAARRALENFLLVVRMRSTFTKSGPAKIIAALI